MRGKTGADREISVNTYTGGFSLIFNHEEIAPGETKVFTPDTHKQGLFSPDCYNGKSLFTMGEEDAEKED